jgi:hypothetical protein
MVLGIRFSPGIQIGFGLEIGGFGGLIGINRRANTDALRERLTSGAAGNVLFIDDPVRNAPSILGDLGALFPAADGFYVFGPTIRLNWLKIAGRKFAHFDLGVIIEFPGPSRIIILGSAVADHRSGPTDDDITFLHLRLDVVGILDFHKQLIEFDATLIGSEALELFVISGDAAFRASYGDRPYMMLSIGGFHPHFNPEPAVFPEMTRVALTLKLELSSLFLRYEAYLAVTTNTFQIGGALETGMHVSSFNAVGFITLDALIQLTPFHFEVSISAGFRIRWGGLTLGGVKLQGTLTGPGPLVLSGSFCFEILFFDVCWSHTFTMGSDSGPVLAAVISVVQALHPELLAPENLAATGGDDKQVAVQLHGTPVRAVISPVGEMTWMQKRVPFNTLIDRFEGNPLEAKQSLTIEATLTSTAQKVGTPIKDWFAPGSFATLTDAEALNRPSFERLDAGLTLGFGDDSSPAVLHTYQVTEYRLPVVKPVLPAVIFAFPLVTLNGAHERTAVAAVRAVTAKVTVKDELFVVRDASGAIVHADRSQADAYQRARFSEGVALPADDIVDIGSI